MEAARIPHRLIAGRNVGVDAERRLHIGEGGDDDPPDALDRVERQEPPVAPGQQPHHRGLAAGPEGGSGLGGLLHRDQPVDDLAALDQEPVHRLVDAVYLLPEVGERRQGLGHGSGIGSAGGYAGEGHRRSSADD
jgi:hypothetical protein